MNTQLHIINAPRSLDPFLEDINQGFSDIEKTISKILPVNDVDVVVWDSPDSSIEQYGMGGHTMSLHYISISLAPKNPNIQNNFIENFKNTLLHEFHHAARLQALPMDYAPRLEISIREGLAEHFEIEILGKKPEVWDTALTSEQLAKFVEIAKGNKSIEDFYVYDWLFGNKELEIPEWTGYSVGFYLVADYLKKHPEQKASTLYAVSAEEFI